MYTVNILIVDDDPDFSDLLKLLLKRLGYEKIYIANSFEDGKQFFKTKNPDLVILDIDLGTEKTGVDLGALFRSYRKELPIIFITNNYQEEVYEETIPIRPNAFLSKELSSLKVRQAVELALDTSTNSLMSSPALTDTISRIFIKIGSYYKKVDLNQIDFFFYEDRHTNAFVEGKVYPMNCTMKEIDQLLRKMEFIQIHQSYIINIDKINKVNFSNSNIEIGDRKLPIGISFKKKIQEALHFLR